MTHWVTVGGESSVATLFKTRLKKWRGQRLHKEAASDLGVALSTYRKWEYGKRTPDKLKLTELERLMGLKPDGMDNKTI